MPIDQFTCSDTLNRSDAHYPKLRLTYCISLLNSYQLPLQCSYCATCLIRVSCRPWLQLWCSTLGLPDCTDKSDRLIGHTAPGKARPDLIMPCSTVLPGTVLYLVLQTSEWYLKGTYEPVHTVGLQYCSTIYYWLLVRTIVVPTTTTCTVVVSAYSIPFVFYR